MLLALRSIVVCSVPVVFLAACGGTDASSAFGNTSAGSTTASTSGAGGSGSSSSTTSAAGGATGAGGHAAGGAQQGTGGAQQGTGGAQQGTAGAQQGTGGAQQGTGGGSPSGACTDAADVAILQQDPAGLQNEVQGCAWQNLGTEPATKNCIKQKTGLSDGCTTCFDDEVGCVMKNCLGACMNGASQACNDCRVKNCDPAFHTCAGF
jgi:hypothetical protein